ncbi:MAG: radical SAM protein [Candidatus Gastranaerophilales bacterium]|nr:radical SAM protein [Candidatus Gastranaerophilales bacterium]
MNFLKKLFRKKKYLNCPYMKHSLHFFHDEIRACCSNVKGPVFYPNYNGKEIDWDKVYQERKNYIKLINSGSCDDPIPVECQGCYMANGFISDEKVENFENKVNTLFIQNHMSCNAKCTYCTFANEDKGSKYEVVPVVKSLIEKGLLDKNSKLILSGGEITITQDFDELVDLLTDNVDSSIYLETSGIKYSEAVANAFKKDKCWQTISLDAGTRETYAKLKQVDCLDTVIDNLKAYANVDAKALERIILKYIIIREVNDNVEEIQKFIDVVTSLGIKHVQLDVDFVEFGLDNDKQVPDYYFDLIKTFNELASKNNIKVCDSQQTEEILKKGRKD